MVIVRWDRGTLLLEGVERAAMPQGFVWDDRVRQPRGDGSLYYETVLALHRSGQPYEDKARGWDKLPLIHGTDKSPRDYQAAALAAWKQAGRRGVVSLPTGSGKSFVAELCIVDTARPTLVVAPTIDLVNQWHANLSKALGCPIGALGGGQHDPQVITVSTYDSAYLHMERYGDRFGLVVFDEVHHLPADAYAQIAEMMLAPYRLGLSATVERNDGLHQRLDELVGPMVYEKGIKELSGAVLADYEVVRIPVDLSPEDALAYEKAIATYRGFIAYKGIRLGGRNGWQNFLREAARSKQGRAALKAHRDSRRIMHATPAKLDVLEQLIERHQGQRTIVANLTNTYEVGEVAAIALEGTFLPGVEIKPRPVFVIPSSGMALGKVSAELDADLTDQFEADAEPRAFEVSVSVKVEARYAEDAAGLVKKAVKQGAFEVGETREA